MKIYVINLKKRPDRLKYISDQLDKMGLEFERFEAIDGADLVRPHPLFDEKRFLLDQKKHIVSGEIGCALSHREIWKKIIEEGLPRALILEDDIEVSGKVKHLLSDIASIEKFDFLNISSAEPYSTDESLIRKLLNDGVDKRPHLLCPFRCKWRGIEWRRKWKVFKLHKTADDVVLCEADPAPALGSGYILSAHGAKHLLKATEEMYFPVDLAWRFSRGRLVQGFSAKPLIVQSLSNTDIEGRDQKNVLNLKQRLLRFFYKGRKFGRRFDVFCMYNLNALKSLVRAK